MTTLLAPESLMPATLKVVYTSLNGWQGSVATPTNYERPRPVSKELILFLRLLLVHERIQCSSSVIHSWVPPSGPVVRGRALS